jgi:hypothetical protein
MKLFDGESLIAAAIPVSNTSRENFFLGPSERSLGRRRGAALNLVEILVFSSALLRMIRVSAPAQSIP